MQNLGASTPLARMDVWPKTYFR